MPALCRCGIRSPQPDKLVEVRRSTGRRAGAPGPANGSSRRAGAEKQASADGRIPPGGDHREARTRPRVTNATGAQRSPKSDAGVADATRRLGIERLHPEQEQVISEVLAGRDVLMILPTGFGKSACYQIPSMVLDDPVVMISPLLALLRDQHRILLERRIDCVRLDGSVRARARREAFERIAGGGPLLVMTTPEPLLRWAPMLERVPSGVVEGMVIMVLPSLA